MLHAITHRKSTFYHRYTGDREPGDVHVSEEDEITSLLMGPLALMSDAAIGAFWRAVLDFDSAGCLADFPPGPPTSANMKFWPRQGNIEPDMLVDLQWGREKRLLVVEFKWHAPLSGEDQLHKQWLEYLSAEERARSCHLFIAPDIHAASEALARRDVWGGRLVMRSWFQILDILSAISGPEWQLLGRWSTEVSGCLGALNIRAFGGFRNLRWPGDFPAGPIFWHTH